MTDQVCIVVGGGKGMGTAVAREMKKKLQDFIDVSIKEL